MNNEDPIIEIPIQVVPDAPEPQSPSKSFAAITKLSLLLSIAILARVVPFSKTVEDDGSVQVRDSWPSLTHYAFGADADMRTEKHKNGRVMSGPLKSGKRHGNWTVRHEGEVTQRTYSFGRER